MNRLLFTLLMIIVTMYTAFGVGIEDNQPASPQAQEGKVLYSPINTNVNFKDEQKIQKDDQNITKHGQVK